MAKLKGRGEEAVRGSFDFLMKQGRATAVAAENVSEPSLDLRPEEKFGTPSINYAAIRDAERKAATEVLDEADTLIYRGRESPRRAKADN